MKHKPGPIYLKGKKDISIVIVPVIRPAVREAIFGRYRAAAAKQFIRFFVAKQPPESGVSLDGIIFEQPLVILPVLTGFSGRIHAALFSF
ncbi:MAG: hypothetical protein KL839_19675 [Rhizobium sp.]|nr:hypothetical protein [Rhizobium sp.]